MRPCLCSLCLTAAEIFVLPVAADPHIKVCGRRDNVKEAKDRIMSVLDTKVNISVSLLPFLFGFTPFCCQQHSKTTPSCDQSSASPASP